jgi:hypothetical protein
VDPNLINVLTGFVPPIAAETVLAVAACVLFVGGAFRGGRRLWGWSALVSLALAGVALAWTAAAVPTQQLEDREVRRLAAQASTAWRGRRT